MIGGKLGEVLNKDVGALVKDASKVLNADLGDLVRGRLSESAEPPAAPSDDAETQFAATELAAAAPTAAPVTRERLDESLVRREGCAMPSGFALAELLPFEVGDYRREPGSANGQIASDPVETLYQAEGETIHLTLTCCWDRLEAMERIASIKPDLTRGTRIAPDGTWIAGRLESGIAFAWMRETYCFSVRTPGGVPSLAKFLNAFPY